MPLTNDLSNLAAEANAIFNSITANSTAITSMSVAGQVINSSGFAVTATFSNTFTVGNAVYFIANGHVGFGTSTPAERLGVGGSILIGNQLTSNSSTTTLRLTTDPSATFIQSGLNLSSNSAAPLIFGSIYGGSEWMRITNDGRVGIGTNNPGAAQKLDVAGKGRFSDNLTIAGGYSVQFVESGGNNSWLINNELNDLKFTYNSTERARINASGIMTKPAHPAFCVSSRQINGYYNNVTVVYKNVHTNNGSYYSTSTGRFTAPVTGHYFFSATGIVLNGGGGNGELNLRKNGGVVTSAYSDFTSVFQPVTVTATIYLAVNDYVDVYAGGTVLSWFDNGGTFVAYNNFSGYLIG